MSSFARPSVSLKLVSQCIEDGTAVFECVGQKDNNKTYSGTRFGQPGFILPGKDGRINNFSFVSHSSNEANGEKMTVVNNFDPNFQRQKSSKKKKDLYATTQMVLGKDTPLEYTKVIDFADDFLKDLFENRIKTDDALATSFGIIPSRIKDYSITYRGPTQRIFSFEGADESLHGKALDNPIYRVSIDTRVNSSGKPATVIYDYKKPYTTTTKNGKKLVLWETATDEEGNPMEWTVEKVNGVDTLKTNLHKFITSGSTIKRANFFFKVTYKHNATGKSFAVSTSVFCQSMVVDSAEPVPDDQCEDMDQIDSDILAILESRNATDSSSKQTLDEKSSKSPKLNDAASSSNDGEYYDGDIPEEE